MTLKRSIFRVLVAGLAMLPAIAARAETPPREYQVKAAFIYNFVQFVDWPARTFADEKSPIVVGTVGNDPFRGALEQAMDGKSVGGRKLIVKHFAAPADIQECQVLFVGAATSKQLPAILEKIRAGGVLTVGEDDRFLPGGGMIRFLEEGGKLRFEINPQAAEAARLRISSKLLKLAKIYHG